MLSPGEWHKSVPRERNANLRFRRSILRQCKDKKKQQAMMQACEQDFVFWVNTFVWQFNPNAIGKGSEESGPFITWEFQEEVSREILACVEDRHDAVIEKSREMGASWLCLLIMCWLFLFHRNKKFLCISRDEASVDRSGDSDSLFWKLDYVLEHLPSWMTRGRVERAKLRFSNPKLKSSITGQASTGKAGVGGRATAMFIDEFSQIAEDFEVLHRTSDTTGCRIFNGTHKGAGTAFYELTRRVDWKKIRMHWTQHPDKRKGLYESGVGPGGYTVRDKQYEYPTDYLFVMDGSPLGGPFPGLRSPWYDEQCRRKASPQAVAMDLDIDSAGSESQFFDSLLIRQLKADVCCDPYWEGDAVIDRELAAVKSLQRRKGGLIKMWMGLNPEGKPPIGLWGAGADISNGTGHTPSCFSIIDANTGLKVLEYTNPNEKPENFAVTCVALCRLFQNEYGSGAFFAWEMAGPGLIFCAKVLELEYRNIYYRESDYAEKIGMHSQSDRPGWYPTPASKRLLLEEYRSALARREVTNRSKDAIDECLVFTYDSKGNVQNKEEQKKNDPSGAKVNHGDRVIADALAWKMARSLAKPVEARKKEEIPANSLAGRRLRQYNSVSDGRWR